MKINFIYTLLIGTAIILNTNPIFAQLDVGISEVITPLDGTTLTVGNSYTVTVVIQNYGTINPGNVPVQFSVGTNFQLIEDFSGFIDPGDSAEFTFTNQLQVTSDLVSAGMAQTTLFGDLGPGNNRIELYYPYGVASIASQGQEEIPVVVFPNPTEDHLSVFPKNRAQYHVSLLAMDGKILKDYGAIVFSGSEPMEIDISWLAKGNYILSLESDDGSVHKKFIK